MRLLSFDTSGRGLSVAVLKDGVTLVARDRREAAPTYTSSDTPSDKPSLDKKKVDRQESVSLLIPTIDELTREANLKKVDYDAVVVGTGPGGFTGVRVSVVTARTLGQALKLPVIGVDSLSVQAYNLLDNYYDTAGDVVVIVKESSKTHCFFAAYKKGELLSGSDIFELTEIIAPGYKADADFVTYVKETLAEAGHNYDWFLEEALLARFELAGLLKDSPERRVEKLPPVNNSAVTQAKIAYFRLSLKAIAGENLLKGYPYHLIQPLYLRGASVTLKKGDVIERVETH